MKAVWGGRWLLWRTALASAALVCCLLLVGCGGKTASGVGTSLATATPADQITYVAIGASDAYGIGTFYPPTQSWPADLSRDLGPQAHLINLGIPGDTVADALQTQVPVALDAHPTIITVWLATNDIITQVPLTTYQAQLDQLLSALRQGTTARIYVGNEPDLTTLPFFAAWDQQALRMQVEAWNAAIAAACAANGAHLVDLAASWNAVTQHPEYISGDGLHPSVAGAMRLADAFAAAIQASGR